MKRLTISADLARELGRFLEIPAKGGFSRKELRHLDAIQMKIEPLVAEYERDVTEVVDEFNQERQETLSLTETARDLTLRRIADEEREALKRLTDGPGADAVDLVLEEEEFSFARQHLEAIEQFNGPKEVRRVVFGLDDAFDAAVAVRVVDGKIEPVDVDAEVSKVRDFQRRRAAERRRR